MSQYDSQRLTRSRSRSQMMDSDDEEPLSQTTSKLKRNSKTTKSATATIPKKATQKKTLDSDVSDIESSESPNSDSELDVESDVDKSKPRKKAATKATKGKTAPKATKTKKVIPPYTVKFPISIGYSTQVNRDLLGDIRMWDLATDGVDPSEPCMVGIDEAGRGPVLGSMVYGTCLVPNTKVAELKALGVNDSKQLKEADREYLLSIIQKTPYLRYIVDAIHPETISSNMLHRTKTSLNEVSFNSAITLVFQYMLLGFNVTECYADTVGPPEKYKQLIISRIAELTTQYNIPNTLVKVVVESKADATYPVVSAASICAKVTRDMQLADWQCPEEQAGMTVSRSFGSGYPGDEVTKTWLRQHLDPIFGFPNLVRFSWGTASAIIETDCVKVDWGDIQVDPKDPKKGEAARAAQAAVKSKAKSPFLTKNAAALTKQAENKHDFSRIIQHPLMNKFNRRLVPHPNFLLNLNYQPEPILPTVMCIQPQTRPLTLEKRTMGDMNYDMEPSSQITPFHSQQSQSQVDSQLVQKSKKNNVHKGLKTVIPYELAYPVDPADKTTLNLNKIIHHPSNTPATTTISPLSAHTIDAAFPHNNYKPYPSHITQDMDIVQHIIPRDREFYQNTSSRDPADPFLEEYDQDYYNTGNDENAVSYFGDEFHCQLSSAPGVLKNSLYMVPSVPVQQFENHNVTANERRNARLLNSQMSQNMSQNNITQNSQPMADTSGTFSGKNNNEKNNEKNKEVIMIPHFVTEKQHIPMKTIIDSTAKITQFNMHQQYSQLIKQYNATFTETPCDKNLTVSYTDLPDTQSATNLNIKQEECVLQSQQAMNDGIDNETIITSVPTNIFYQKNDGSMVVLNTLDNNENTIKLLESDTDPFNNIHLVDYAIVGKAYKTHQAARRAGFDSLLECRYEGQTDDENEIFNGLNADRSDNENVNKSDNDGDDLQFAEVFEQVPIDCIRPVYTITNTHDISHIDPLLYFTQDPHNTKKTTEEKNSAFLKQRAVIQSFVEKHRKELEFDAEHRQELRYLEKESRKIIHNAYIMNKMVPDCDNFAVDSDNEDMKELYEQRQSAAEVHLHDYYEQYKHPLRDGKHEFEDAQFVYKFEYDENLTNSGAKSPAIFEITQ